MNNKRLNAIISEHADKIEEAENGYWRYMYKDQTLLTITDESHNRMRIISPAALSKDLNQDALQICMEANFDRALDARYAISGEYLWSAFIHSLAELTDKQVVDAMDQVATLTANYGTTFTSSDLLFGGG